MAAHRALGRRSIPASPPTTRSGSPPTRPAKRRSPSPGPAVPGTVRWPPIGGLLPAQQRDRLGRRRPVAHLHHPHRRGGRLPLAQGRTRPAPHLPPHAAAGRRPPVHHGHRLPTRTGHSHPTASGTATPPVGPRCAASSTASCESPPPSGAPTDARCTCERPRNPNPSSGTSTTRSASTRTRSARHRTDLGHGALPRTTTSRWPPTAPTNRWPTRSGPRSGRGSRAPQPE